MWATKMVASFARCSTQAMFTVKSAPMLRMVPPVITALSITNYQIHNLVEILLQRQSEEQGLSERLAKSLYGIMAENICISTVGSPICDTGLDVRY
jgi:hypothetical protein